MISACRTRDLGKVFKLAHKRAGIYPSLIARRCDLTPSRVGEVMAGKRTLTHIDVIERVAAGLRIPGFMLGLAPLEWEEAIPTRDQRETWSGSFRLPSMAGTPVDLPYMASVIEEQLPQHYTSANVFGARSVIPLVSHHVCIVVRALETAEDAARHTLLRTASKIAEFLGWLYQDLGEFANAAFWSDRTMEWAQESADDQMQSYILFRKSNQATARSRAQQAIGLARAAQRVPNATPRIKALAAQQEAQAHALLGNIKIANDLFDKAHDLALTAGATETNTSVDTSYCTPTYIEIQRANCWIHLGRPERAIPLFQRELELLAPVYRNDRSVYLACLAHACIKAGEPEQGIEAGDQALAIAGTTGSARTLAELGNAIRATGSRVDVPAVVDFRSRYQAVRDEITSVPSYTR